MKSSTDHPALVREWLPVDVDSLPEAGESPAPAGPGQDGFSSWMPAVDPFPQGSRQEPVEAESDAPLAAPQMAPQTAEAHTPTATQAVLPGSGSITSWLPASFPQACFGAADGGPLRLDDPAWSLFFGSQEVIFQEDLEREARQERERLLAEAQQQAAEILSRARLEAEKARLQAYQEGLEASRAETAGLLALANQIVAGTRENQEAVFKNSEFYLLELVRDIAQKLFGPGFVLDPVILSRTFESALSEAKALGDLRIRAHPEDVASLGQLWPAQQTALRGQQIELVPDQDIRRGGFTIEGQFGSIDGRLETQLGMVFETMNGIINNAQTHSTPFAEQP